MTAMHYCISLYMKKLDSCSAATDDSPEVNWNNNPLDGNSDPSVQTFMAKMRRKPQVNVIVDPQLKFKKTRIVHSFAFQSLTA